MARRGWLTPDQPMCLVALSALSNKKRIYKGYGNRSGISLSSLTHEAGSPWDVTVKQSGTGSVISNDLIEDFYRQLASR